MALVNPNPYPVALSSLGFQTIYRGLNLLADTVAERAFLPEPGEAAPLCTYESRRPAADYPVVALSLAYELELSGMFSCFSAMGVEPLRTDRTPRDPLVVIGGPLTFSNPLPLSPFADVIVVGEGEGALEPLLAASWGAGSRRRVLEQLAGSSGFYVPLLHGTEVPPLLRADDDLLPARSEVTSPESALPSMFLVEVARGCARQCVFCLMRRRDEPSGGMRRVPADRVLAAIPAGSTRVGLVGAAVCDHPQIIDIVRGVVEAGREIGLSSLRADKLTPELVKLLAAGGNRTVTVAADGASERLRAELQKGIIAEHLVQAVGLAAGAGIPRVKVYVMIGTPGETDDDLAELIALTERLADTAGRQTRIVLAVSPLVPKLNTPLGAAAFVGTREADRRAHLVRRALEPRVVVRVASARWAWIEYQLAQGGPEAGLAALAAWQEGGRFADFKRAFTEMDAGFRNRAG